ncbi:carboxypeptidase regulatory-like domain-containing protein [Actinotalea sp. M2MS4P-6]|uniref:carboxypeptidase regulatory-like domain-containing protein n=1 Tax=Actinotalea sp. M2MS4P-6 TaxID=2983762 RepID=UPI0021E381B0|nr:carboxypeptidase regulatory-like domain-containing protein [Actinotalea sp. M2MS4P-6]MCV2395223.1 carboxypeptidase regulatory-like domain-containing protein [Actinotalea sp. M2MS4P-6]
MRVISGVDTLEVAPGGTGEISLDVVNTGAVIDAISAHVVGLPIEHATSRPPVLTLFPDATGQLVVRLDLPSSFPAGTHPITVQLSGRSGATEAVHHDVDVVVGARPALALAASPSTVRARRRATFPVQVSNRGNVPLDVALRANDADRSLQVALSPSTVSLQPGAVASVAVQVQGPRHLVGSERERPLQVEATALEQTETVALVLRQRPALSPGLLTALVLATILAVWAAIFLLGVRTVLGADPYTKIAPPSYFAATVVTGTGAGAGTGAGTGTAAGGAAAAAPAGAVPRDGALPAGVGGTLAGTVTAASDAQGVGRITVEAWRRTTSGLVLVGSAATQEDGSYAIAGLFPGPYLVSVRADGYQTVWYPAAPGDAGATTVDATSQSVTDGVDLTIEGDPAVINGTVDVGDVTTPVVTTVVARATWARDDPTLTRTVDAAPDGTYTLTDVVAPGTYELSFTAPGYQPTTVTETVTGGQTRFAPTVTLASGAGQISGLVTDGSRPLGGVVVSTTVDGTPIVVGTPTLGSVGTFVIPGLPTPGTYVVTFTADGFTPATAVVDLAAGESKTDVAVTMTGGAGTVTGRIVGPDGAGLGGVTVTATGGASPVTGTSLTTGTVGSFTLAGLQPGLYTLMVSLPGYTDQSVAVDLSSGIASAVTVTLRPSWGTVQGVVRTGSPPTGTAGVQVQATDGQKIWTTTSTAVAGSPSGFYSFAQLPPGSYSVTLSSGGRVVATAVVTVTAGSTVTQDLTLPAGG